MASKIKSLPVKITSIVSKIAPIVGTVKGLLGDPLAQPDPVQFMIERVTAFKIANPIITTQLALQQGEDKYPIISGAVIAAIGFAIKEVAEAVDIPAKGAIKNMGSAAIGFGVAASISAVIAAWIWLAPFNPHGAKGGQPAATTSGRVPAPVGSFETSTPSRGGYIAPML